MREEMKAMVRDNAVCVMATVSRNKPHCSFMSYCTDDSCKEIYMMSRRQSRKFSNLMENMTVSLLIDTRERNAGKDAGAVKALTVSGVFQYIDEAEKKARIKQMLMDRHPHLGVIADEPDMEIFSIAITGLQLLDGVSDVYFDNVD